MIIKILIGLCVLLVLAVAAFLWLIVWIGKGEPDVNGDPERDAGVLPCGPTIVCGHCKKAIFIGDYEIRQSLCESCFKERSEIEARIRRSREATGSRSEHKPISDIFKPYEKA